MKKGFISMFFIGLWYKRLMRRANNTLSLYKKVYKQNERHLEEIKRLMEQEKEIDDKD